MALSVQHLRASGSRVSQRRKQQVSGAARLHSPPYNTTGGTVASAARPARVARVSTVAKAGAEPGPLPDMSLGSDAISAAGMDFDITSKATTVFVPSNDAIKSYAAATGWTKNDLATSAGQIAVTGHVIPNAKLLSKDFPEGTTSYDTEAGTKITVKKSGSSLSVCVDNVTANVMQRDMETGNAVIYLIDKVLAPEGTV